MKPSNNFIDFKQINQCQICNQKFNTFKGLISHITTTNGKHKLTTQEYYNQYFKKELDGICLKCKKPTKWYNSTGYAIFCSKSCKISYLNNNNGILTSI